jgi:hypothetical protein
MKKIIFYIFVVVFFIACNNKKNNTETENQQEIDAEITTNTINQDGVYGYYFADNTIRIPSQSEDEDLDSKNLTIAIYEINDKMVAGQRIINGSASDFVGTVTKENGIYLVEADEPKSDNKNGRFLFYLNEKERTIKGEWVAYDANSNVKKILFELKKEKFTYNKDINLDEYFGFTTLGYSSDGTAEMATESVIYINASNVLLEANDVSNLYKGDLELIRNTIFARHGFAFQSRKMRFLLEGVNWYVPISTDVYAKLTAIEKKNIDLIKRYEEYAERNYQFFAR